MRLRLACRDGRIAALAVEPSRRSAATRIFANRPAQDVVELLPRLFRLCGKAQGVAAKLAVEAARGGAHADIAAARRAVVAEALQESLWRILMDWPRLIGEEADPAALSEARGMDESVRLAVFLERRVFGEPLACWRARMDSAQFADWAANGRTTAARVFAHLVAGEGAFGAGAARTLPAMDGEQAHALAEALMLDETFSLYPVLGGQPMETGARARLAAHAGVAEAWRRGAGVSARFAARLVELAEMAWQWSSGELAEDWVGACSVEDGAGLAWAETARGRLVHYVRLMPDGRVADYRIVAPTEWNFHPQGALAEGLLGVAAANADAARNRAWLMVQVLDPCVACEIEVNDA